MNNNMSRPKGAEEENNKLPLTEASPVDNVAPANPDLLIPHSGSQSHLLLIISGALAGIALLLMAGFFVLNWYIRSQELKPDNKQTVKVQPTPSKAPDLTASWKTYNSNSYSFKYPADWDYNPDSASAYYKINNTLMALVSSIITSANAERGLKYDTITKDNFYDPKNDFWINGKSLYDTKSSDYKDPTIQMIGDKKFIAQAYYSSQNYEFGQVTGQYTNYYYWLGKNNLIFKITTYVDLKYPQHTELQKEITQILSTFKFTR